MWETKFGYILARTSQEVESYKVWIIRNFGASENEFRLNLPTYMNIYSVVNMKNLKLCD